MYKTKKPTGPAKKAPIRNINEILKAVKRTPKLENEIKDAAYFLSEKGLAIEVLNWLYAETQLKISKGVSKVSEAEIKKKAEEISSQSLSYEDLCWKISELNILIEKKLI
jgi:hypothetical protein